MASLDVGILGPLQLRDGDGAEIRVPAGRERTLLVLLLIQRGEIVSSDRIVDALWGARPPETAMKAVQGYVSHLRDLLEPGRDPGAAGSLLVTRPPGYALRADGLEIDSTRFERMAADARRALDDGSPAEAARMLDEALALWRGPPLADLAFEEFAQHEIHRLDELRLAATEDRLEALLQLGRHGDVVSELAALVAAHPLRERLRGQAMLALYRCGRQADALALYRDGRRLSAGELGLEPGPQLQRLERAILAQDPALEIAQPVVRALVRRAHRRRRAIAATLVAVALAAVLLVVVRTRGGSPAPVRVAVPSVVAIDPRTDRIVASIRTGSKPTSISVRYGSVWVGDAVDGTVTRIDPVTRQVVKTIGIAAPAIDLATGLGSVWAATGGFGTIVRIDPTVDAPTQRIDLGRSANPIVPAASSVAVADGRLWVGAFGGLALLDPGSGRVVRRISLGASPALGLAVGDGAVWATTVARSAQRVDASSATRTATFYAGTEALALALGRSALWVAGVYGGQLWTIDPATGSNVRTAQAGKGATALALGFHAVWVTSWPDNSVVRVDPVTRTVRSTIAVGGTPEDIAVGYGLVWVAVQTHPDEG